jgi:signal recognition particle GTPase
MFESLSNRLQDVFRNIRGEGRLTEETVELALREIRMALLEADVNFKVVKAFIDRVRDRAVDREVLKSLSPDQQVVRIVRDEMLALFGDAQGGLPATAERPRVIMLLGLQGSGKTTTSAKLGRWLTKQGRHPLLVSTDVRRPAAIQQLAVVGKQAGVRVHDPAGEEDAAKLEEKLRRDDFTLEDFRDQLRTIRKMGPLEQIIGMLPGMGAIKELKQQKDQVDEKQMLRVEAIINSMTDQERRNHQLINGQRRKRIAKGSGTSVEEVNKLLKQFIQMKKMLKAMGGMAGLAKGKRPSMSALKGLMR